MPEVPHCFRWTEEVLEFKSILFTAATSQESGRVGFFLAPNGRWKPVAALLPDPYRGMSFDLTPYMRPVGDRQHDLHGYGTQDIRDMGEQIDSFDFREPSQVSTPLEVNRMIGTPTSQSANVLWERETIKRHNMGKRPLSALIEESYGHRDAALSVARASTGEMFKRPGLRRSSKGRGK